MFHMELLFKLWFIGITGTLGSDFVAIDHKHASRSIWCSAGKHPRTFVFFPFSSREGHHKLHLLLLGAPFCICHQIYQIDY